MDNSLRSPITRLRTLIESWIFQTTAPAPDSREHRNTAHCTMDRPVEIRRSGAESGAVVTIMDVSLTGAAVRLPDDITPDHELSELAQGDEIALSGLVAIPLDCWVVARDGAVLRLRFFPAPEAEARLQTLIGRLAGKSPEPGPLQPAGLRAVCPADRARRAGLALPCTGGQAGQASASARRARGGPSAGRNGFAGQPRGAARAGQRVYCRAGAGIRTAA
ncbi:MAG: PilZ domain-containing protein [Rhodopila sp.]